MEVIRVSGSNADNDIYKEEVRGGDKTGGRETNVVIIVITIIKNL